jgi:hypothetical protein
MIPPMTNPEVPAERRVGTVPIVGHEFTVKELTDTQIMHLNRHARILGRDNVAADAKSESADRMFTILHNCVVDPEQLEFLIGLEENGDVTLRDLMVFATHFRTSKDETPAVVRRRGRPRKSVS